MGQAITAAAALLSCFTPYRDTHHQAWDPQTAKYKTIKGAATEQHATAHLAGETGLGISMLLPDSTVRWGALDVDDLETRMVSPADLARVVAKHDAPLVPCRTKSGDAHLLLFFHNPVPAAQAREVLRGLNKKLGLDQLDGPEVEIFPKRTTPGPKGSAPGLNLPYFGNDLGTNRYAMDAKGKRVSFRQFLDLVACQRTVTDGMEHVPEPRRHMGDFGAGVDASPGAQSDAYQQIQTLVVAAWAATVGQRVHHRLALGVGGLLAKAGMTSGEVEAIVAAACSAGGDNEIQDRIKAVRDSFSAGRTAAGKSLIAELAGAGVANDLGRAVLQWKRAAGLVKGGNTSAGKWLSASKPTNGTKKPKGTNGTHATPADQPPPDGESLAPPAVGDGGSAVPLGDPSGDEPAGGDSPDDPGRMPAIEVVRRWALAIGQTPGPLLQYRDGEKAYAANWGLPISSSGFAECFSLEVRDMLLAEAAELAYVSVHGAEKDKDKYARQVWNQWAKNAFRQAMRDLPERGEIAGESRQEHAKLPYVVIACLAKPVPVNEPGESVFYESVLSRARATMSTSWDPFGLRGAFVRRSDSRVQIAIRFDFILDMAPEIAAGIGSRKRFANLCRKLRIGKSTAIRAGGEVCRAVVLNRRFLSKLLDKPRAVEEANEQADLGFDAGDQDVGPDFESEHG